MNSAITMMIDIEEKVFEKQTKEFGGVMYKINIRYKIIQIGGR